MGRVIRILLPLALLLSALCAGAQEKIRIQGKVTSTDGTPLVGEAVRIYGYDTVREGDEAKNAFNKWKTAFLNGTASSPYFNPPGLFLSTTPDNHGEFEVLLPSRGSILFLYQDNPEEPPKLEAVKNRVEINVAFNTNLQLRSTTIIGSRNGEPEPDEVILEGDTLSCGGNLPIPAKLGKPDARLGYQVFMLRHKHPIDTVFFTPIVRDGGEYHTTQLRRKDFDPAKDSLFIIAEGNAPLSDTTTSIVWRKNIPLDSPDERVYVRARAWMEDYNRIYWQNDSIEWADTKRARRPLYFLDYNLSSYMLPDDDEYKRRPKRERRGDAKELALKFLVGKSQLDPNDTISARDLRFLEEEIGNLQRDPDITLQYCTVNGLASPEGAYSKNLQLAGARMKFLESQIRQWAPQFTFATNPRVATWEEVADLLYADSLKTEAAALRDAVAKYPKNPDAQWAAARKLSFYRSVIEPVFPRLRKVEAVYTYSVYRELTDEEILDKYQHDKDFRSGKKEFTLHEFDRLFRMVENREELEALCKRAIKVVSKTPGENWPVPANVLAVSYINRDTVDTELLAPYVELHWGRCNQSYTSFEGVKMTKNPEAIVANQVVMLLKGNKNTQANITAKILPAEYEDLYSLTLCLAGRYKQNTPEAARVRERVIASSPRNASVIHLAMKNVLSAEEAMEQQDRSLAVTDYLWAQFYCRKNQLESSCTKWSQVEDVIEADKMLAYLTRCFRRDPSYLEIAERDGYMFEDLYLAAKKEYENPQDDIYADPVYLNLDSFGL